MNPIKDAFNKVKEDMESLRHEILTLNFELKELKDELTEFIYLNKVKKLNPTDNLQNPTDNLQNPTDNLLFKLQKVQILGISNGNEGVPTDRQTNQQTNQHIQNEPIFKEKSLENAINILNSLDSIKKEIRLRFKELTDQEFRVFSMIYQLDEEEGHSDYRTISKRLNLSESSVRDYIGKLVNKGIPVEKIKINNKIIHLSISPNLKKIATLSTILQLREL